MGLQQRLKKIAENYPGIAYSILPFNGVSRPIFIIGCGRSGTTILGRTLSWHRDITYLNEPRELWFSAYPRTDIWTSKAPSRKGKLALAAADTQYWRSKKLSHLFHLETISNGAPVFIEKLPINNFRLHFIHKIFPDARFIHIYRNGVEVAKSIQKLSDRGGWFGANSYKWDKLVEYAENKDDTFGLPALCDNNFDKGLLEWRLSTEAAIEFLSQLPKEKFFEFKYDELVENPVEAISNVLEFIGIGGDSAVNKFVDDKLERRTRKLGHFALSEKEQLLGGKLLPLSMEEGKGLVGKR